MKGYLKISKKWLIAFMTVLVINLAILGKSVYRLLVYKSAILDDPENSQLNQTYLQFYQDAKSEIRLFLVLLFVLAFVIYKYVRLRRTY